MAELVVLVNVACAWFMTGLIWFVQVVHYPLFARVGGDFCAYHRLHTRWTTMVVAPVMLAEAVAAGALLMVRPAGVSAGVAWAGAVLAVLLWVSTAAEQVPCHRRLAGGFDAAGIGVRAGVGRRPFSISPGTDYDDRNG